MNVLALADLKFTKKCHFEFESGGPTPFIFRALPDFQFLIFLCCHGTQTDKFVCT